MYKIHRQNHDFQIAYFLAGACHTPDGAYALLQGLKEEREAAIKNYSVTELKNKAKTIRAEKLLQGTEAEKLDGEAELLEIENNKESGKVLYNAAKDELDYINYCIDIVNPLRRYKDLSDADAYEEAQREEWKLELIKRAENSILTTGTILTDHYDTMRMHPDFITEILPKIDNTLELTKTKTPIEMAKLLKPDFNLPKLLK